jgi:AP-1 complex subunit beta-1
MMPILWSFHSLTTLTFKVVANAIQALGEIQESAPELNAFDINGKIHSKLLVALNECTE